MTSPQDLYTLHVIPANRTKGGLRGMFFRKRKPVGNDNRPVPSQPTHIGGNSTLDGSISSDGEIHIEGTLRGIVKAQVCVVEANGIVEGEVDADDIIIRGRVTGPLRGDHVHLQDGAWVQGDISCTTIAIDNGARLSGAVWQDGGSEQSQAQPPRRETPALGYQEPSQLFGDSLWGARQVDDFRPLKTIKPRASNGSS